MFFFVMGVLFELVKCLVVCLFVNELVLLLLDGVLIWEFFFVFWVWFEEVDFLGFLFVGFDFFVLFFVCFLFVLFDVLSCDEFFLLFILVIVVVWCGVVVI